MAPKHVSAGRILPVALLIAATALSGCAGIGRALGTSKVSPDEFAIITKAPLVIPPDYSLKPPAPTERSDELDTTAAAQSALMGDAASGQQMSAGERALVSAAGANYADPLIRAVVDQEYAGLIDKGTALSDRLIFWDRPRPTVNAQINPGAEALRMERRQTGGKVTERAEASAKNTDQAMPAPTGSEPDQVKGQNAPTIGETHSRLLDGIF